MTYLILILIGLTATIGALALRAYETPAEHASRLSRERLDALKAQELSETWGER